MEVVVYLDKQLRENRINLILRKIPSKIFETVTVLDLSFRAKAIPFRTVNGTNHA